MPANQEAYAKARARVRQKTLLYSHIAVYVLGIVALFVVNATAGPDAQRGNWWVIYPAAAWGGVVLVHAALLWSGVLPGGRGGWLTGRIAGPVSSWRVTTSTPRFDPPQAPGSTSARTQQQSTRWWNLLRSPGGSPAQPASGPADRRSRPGAAVKLPAG